ncbi:MAG: GTP-binding protein [Promethearchaeota archaeon]
MADQERMNLIITGHVDHGKSTGLGHLMFLLGHIHDPKKQRPPWRIAEKYFLDSKAAGMGSWSYAWILQGTPEERERGLTINIAFQEFQTKQYTYNLIDAPGHADFVKNLITGASQADAAVLVVSARKGEFEDGVKRTGTASGKYANVIGMTIEHMLLLISLGIHNIVVMVNKMDVEKWSQERYDSIKKQIHQMFGLLMSALQVEKKDEILDRIKYVPTSGLYGINMLPKDQTIANLENHIAAAESSKANEDFITSLKEETEEIKKQWPTWYDGPSLMEALDSLPSPKERQASLAKQDLRVPIQSVLNISGVGTVLTGRIASGVLKPNSDVLLAPTKQSLDPVPIQIKTIQEFHKNLPEAAPGDNVGFNIKAKNLAPSDVLRGAVISAPKNPAKALRPNHDGFLGIVLVVRALGKKKGKGKEDVWAVHVNYTPVVHCGTAQVACRVMEMRDLAGKEIAELRQNDRGMVWFTPLQPIVVEPIATSPTLGRFALRDSGKTVAVGIIEKTEEGRYKKAE